MGDLRLAKYISSHSPELEKELDSDTEIVYNKKRNVRYISYNKIGEEAVRHIRMELEKLYASDDGVADGLAIEYEGTVYIVDSGREKGKLTFGIRRRKKASARLRNEFIRSTNNDAVSKGYVSDELSSRVEHGIGSDSGRNMRREFGEELSSNKRESQNNEGRVFEDNGHNGGLTENSTEKIKYSRKKRTYYNQHNELLMRWAYSSSTKSGDKKIFYNGDNNTWNLYIAEDTEEKYGLLKTIEDKPENAEIISDMRKEAEYEDNKRKSSGSQIVYEAIAEVETSRRNNGSNNFGIEERGADVRIVRLHQGEFASDGVGDIRRGVSDSGSLSENSTEKIKYSRKSTEKSESVPIDRYIPGMTRKQIIKTIANIKNKKIYSTSDARKVAMEIEAMLVFEDSYGKLSGKGDITEQIKVKIKKRQAHLEACRFFVKWR